VGCHELGIADKEISSDPRVAGCIGNEASRPFWKDVLCAPKDVINIIENGYRIPWIDEAGPPKSELRNNRSATEMPEFVEEQLSLLERIGAIEACKEIPHITMPLSVVYSNKWRMLSDGSRNLNPYIKERKVTLSHLGSFHEGFSPDSWMRSCDLESGYWQVPIHPSHTKYLGIAWTWKGKKKYFVWRVLFLGIRDAVFVFTKLLKPHIRFCQRYGIFIVIYIDDQLTAAQSKEICNTHSDFAELCLELAGWKIKALKGMRTARQDGVFLGLRHDLINLFYYIPEVKLEDILQFGKWLLKQRRVPVRQIASFYGKISSCRLAIGPVTSLICRTGQRMIAINTENSWEGWVTLSSELIAEIKFLVENLGNLNGFPMKMASSVTPNRVMASDASDFALASAEVTCGAPGFHRPHPGPCVQSPLVQRMLTSEECLTSSTLRELLAVWDTYVLRGDNFAKQSVLHLCDNKNVEIILKKGSGTPALQKLAFEIFLACREKEIILSAQWLPRTDSRIAVVDVMSKWADLSDWGLQEHVFAALCEKCNEFGVDIFAADYNFRVKTFFSPVPSQFGIGLNAFCYDWSKFGFGYACPPVKMIIAAIKHAVMCRSEGILVVPFWPTSSFWKFLTFDGRHLNRMFVNHESAFMALRSGPLVKSTMFSGIPSFKMMVLHFDAEVFDPLLPNVKSRSCLYGGCQICRS
jgi:hypothetical protein